MADSTPKSYSSDPTLWLYTSLSSGSSHIVTATSRLETILKANKVPFQALDVATDEKARMLWGRRAGKRKLPGLVRMGMVLADLDEVEEWNEYGEIKENLGTTSTPAPATSPPTPSSSSTPSKPPAAPSQPTTKAAVASSTAPIASSASESKLNATETKPSTDAAKPPPAGGLPTSFSQAMRQVGVEAAEKAKQAKAKVASGVKSSNAPSNGSESKPSTAKAEEGDLAKLDNSGPTGMPPPSGTTSAEQAAAPETVGAQVESKADAVPVTAGEKDAEEDEIEPKKDEEAGKKASEPQESKVTEPLVLTDPHAGTTIPTLGTEPEEDASAAEAKSTMSEKPQETKDAVNEAKETGPSDATAESTMVKSEEGVEAAAPKIGSGESSKATEGTAPAPALSQEQSPSAAAPEGEFTKHRGSSITAASKEEIKKIEEAAKIDEEPEEETGEEGAAAAAAAGPISEPKEEEKEQEPAIHITPPASTSGADSRTSGNSNSNPNEDGSQHIKFVGETQGDERERVKATLRKNSPAPNAGDGKGGKATTSIMAEHPREERSRTPPPAAPAESSTTAEAEDAVPAETAETQASAPAADPTKVGDSVAD